jgi:hypothetical protein
MTNQTTAPYTSSSSSTESAWATGAIIFAAVMMMMSGVFQVMVGLVALFENEFYVTTSNYVFQLDATAWGWVHLLVGAAVILAGFGVMRGNLAARILGITLAALSAVANFMFIPYYPFWSIAIIAVDIFVIWALAAHGHAAAE